MIGGVNYFTGQVFDMQKISKAGHKIGANVGFDLAHAAGNISLKLNEWNVDFATWCSYKYLNSGPGGVSGYFIHERHVSNENIPRFAGWWGHNKEDRLRCQILFLLSQRRKLATFKCASYINGCTPSFTRNI